MSFSLVFGKIIDFCYCDDRGTLITHKEIKHRALIFTYLNKHTQYLFSLMLLKYSVKKMRLQWFPISLYVCNLSHQTHCNRINHPAGTIVDSQRWESSVVLYSSRMSLTSEQNQIHLIYL